MAMMAPAVDLEATAVPLREDIWVPAFPVVGTGHSPCLFRWPL